MTKYGTGGTTYVSPSKGICILSVERNNSYNATINISTTRNSVVVEPIWIQKSSNAGLNHCYLFEVEQYDIITIINNGEDAGPGYNHSFYYLALIPEQ